MSVADIAATLHGPAAPGMKREAMMAAVRERHPGASKKAIVRAAFYALTSGVGGDAERAVRLQDFAMAEDGDEAPSAGPRKKHKRKHRHTEARSVQ